jgi:cellulose synthase/poly-beta-1,6-N-acetylglucosamine synthase-like glycosyltransferase
MVVSETLNIVFNQVPLPSGISELDFYGFILPWIFTFAIVWGLLEKGGFFDKKPKVNIALAFVIAFFVTGVGGRTLANFFTNLFGGTAIYLAGILVVLLLLTMVGHKSKIEGKYSGWIAAIIVIIIGIALFLGSSGSFGLRVWINQQTATIIFWIIVILVAAWYITKEGNATPSAPKKEEEKK